MYYRITDLAERWEVSVPTIRRWLREGIPGAPGPFNYSRMGKLLRWSPAQLEHVETMMREVEGGPRCFSKRQDA